jgi:hypothetical protein
MTSRHCEGQVPVVQLGEIAFHLNEATQTLLQLLCEEPAVLLDINQFEHVPIDRLLKK